MVYVLDEASGLVQWNRKTEEVTGYSAQELARLDVLDLFAASDREGAEAAIRHVLQKGMSTLEAAIRTKAGEERYCYFAAIRASLGGRPCVVGFGIDISDRRRDQDEQNRLRRELTRAASEWRQTFDAMEAGIVILGEGWCVTRLNRSAAEWAGRPFARCIGRRLAELGSEEPWITAAGMEVEARVHRAVFRQVRNARDGRSWDLAVTRFGESGEPRWLLLVRDVTTIVGLQESVRQTEQLAAMGTLTAGVAHEVRNPLFAISANMDALEMVLDGKPDVTELVAAVKDQVRRLSKLMVDLLELGRPPTAVLAAGPLERVVDDAVKRCSKYAGRTGVRLEARTGARAHTVLMDSDRLTQVLDNLLQNAVQHTPREGLVTVHVRPFEEEGRTWVRCAVLDEGPGFRPEDLGRVFEPFFSRRRGGTGLGLSIAHRIVEQHAGRLRVRNREEGGAVVSVELPVSVSPDPTVEVPRA